MPAGEDFAFVVLEAEAEEGADDGADAYADVPEAYAPGLLGFLWVVSDEIVSWGWFYKLVPCTT